MIANFFDKKEEISFLLEGMYRKFGFTKYNMNKFEPYSFYMENEKFLDDNRIITFSDPSGKLLALKPDITMSIVKTALKTPKENHKIYYSESVFRVPKGYDEYREIHQIGVEYIGELDLYQKIEILNLAIKSLETISPDYKLCISNMAIILNILNDLSLSLNQRNDIIKYITQKNEHDLNRYLLENKIEDNGVLGAILNVSSDIEKGTLELLELIPQYKDEIIKLRDIFEILGSVSDKSKIALDFSHISSTEYYNGLILTGYISGESSPVLRGGRYDNLIWKMGDKTKSALGFAVDLSAIDKILVNNKDNSLEIKYDENSNVLEMIERANEMFSSGKSFCFKK